MDQLREHSVILSSNGWNPQLDDIDEDLDKYSIGSLWKLYCAEDYDKPIRHSGFLDAQPHPLLCDTPKGAKHAMRKLQKSIDKNSLEPAAASTRTASTRTAQHDRADSISVISSMEGTDTVNGKFILQATVNLDNFTNWSN
jgi:hypothetical protein